MATAATASNDKTAATGNNNATLDAITAGVNAGVEAMRQAAQTASSQEGRASIAEAATNRAKQAQELVTNAVNSEAAQKTFADMKDMLSHAQTLGLDGQKRFRQELGGRIQEEFGEEIWSMLEAIQEVTDHFHQELKMARARYGPLTLAVALPLVHMEHDQAPPPRTTGELKDFQLMDDACHWVKFAQAAYGLYTNDVAQGDDKAKVLRALDNTAEVVMANLQPKGVQSPGHFVAVDRKRQAIVLGIRGTSNMSDAITDAVGQPVPVSDGSKTLAHKAMLASARQLLDKVQNDLESTAPGCKGYKVVVTGHSLGAGTAILCTELLRTREVKGLFPGAKLQCFAYAPPPVLGPKGAAAMEGVEVYSFVNRFDLVPRASMSNGFHLGREAMAVDGLELSIVDRLNLLGGSLAAPKEHKDKVVQAVSSERDLCAKEEHPKFQKLYIPGKVFWIEWPEFVPNPNEVEGEGPETVAPPVTKGPEQGGIKGIAPAAGAAVAKAAQGKQDAKPEMKYLPQKVHKVDTDEFQRLLIPASAGALGDHLVSNYITGLQIWRNTLEREEVEKKKNLAEAKANSKSDGDSKCCCTVQ
mmetsp:Transcript_27083/g.62640  ORF Transcript_27083/g.62640 Transcript_27083/m.62640 type:complete len:585 (-) Transcript_27083:61-1815(-)